MTPRRARALLPAGALTFAAFACLGLGGCGACEDRPNPGPPPVVGAGKQDLLSQRAHIKLKGGGIGIPMLPRPDGGVEAGAGPSDR